MPDDDRELDDVEIDDDTADELLGELGGVDAVRMGPDHPYDPAGDPDAELPGGA